MAKVTNEELIANFHSLSGATIGEQRKNLFLLLNRVQQPGSDFDFSLLHPKTPLEEKFKVEILIHFKRTSDLVKVLQCENPILIKKVLKVGSWFWQEAFQDVIGEQLTTQIFPFISFNVKVKIVNRLSLYLSSEKADEYFRAIEASYGLYLSSKLLTACSLSLIMDYVKFNRIKPTPRQLLIIVKKYPEITKDFLKIINDKAVAVAKPAKRQRSFDFKAQYKSVFVYFAKYDVALFFKLCEEYKLNIRLGWRITDKYIRAHKEEVIKNPTMHYHFLHEKQIPKSLQEDFQELYLNLFRESANKSNLITAEHAFDFFDVRYKCLSLINQLPAKIRDPQLYITTFERVFGTPIQEETYYISPELLKMLTPDQRETLMQVDKLPACFSEEEWSSYWKTPKSIPFLKKKISLTSDIRTRIDLMKLLVKTCALNADKEALARVCYYMLTKHRNDSTAVRRAFLRTLSDKFNLTNLEEKHWNYINEILQLFELNNESFDEADVFLRTYILFCYKNNLSVEAHVTNWLKTEPHYLHIDELKPEHEKHCLLLCGKIIPQQFTEDNLIKMNIRLLLALIKWNTKHENDQISLFTYSELIESFKNALRKPRFLYNFKPIIKYLLRLKVDSVQKTELLTLTLKYHKHIDEEVMRYFLSEGSLAFQNIEIITRCVLRYKSPSLFLKFCKNYSPNEIPQTVIKIVLNALEQQKDPTVLKNSVTVLSYLMPPNEFLAFTLPYRPGNLQADTKIPEKMVTIQEQIGVCFKNLIPSSVILDNILSFSKPHSVKLIRRSLYSLCSNTNEDKLIPFINQLKGRVILISKHALHLSFGLLDAKQKLDTLQQFMKLEKKPFVCRLVFKTVFNYFIKNPNDYSWELLRSRMNIAEAKDKKLLDLWMQIDKIPTQFKVCYLIFTWQILNDLSDVHENVVSMKVIVLNSFAPEVISSIPKEFCETIINDHLFNNGDCAEFIEAVQAFACYYVIYCNDQLEQENRLKLIFDILKIYISNKWHNPQTRLISRQRTTSFLRKFCESFLDGKCLNYTSLAMFTDSWNNFLKPHEAFDQYLHLQFTSIYAKKLSLCETARELAKLYDGLIQCYGPTLLDMYCNKINSFINYFVQGAGDDLERNRYIFIEGFIEVNCSVARLLLVILLLNSNKPRTSDGEEKCNKIVEMLQKTEDPVILLYLNRHFTGVTSIHYY